MINLFNPPQEPIHAPVYILHGSTDTSASQIEVSNSNTRTSQVFEITKGFFKCIVQVARGRNELVLTVNSHKKHDSAQLAIQYEPLLQNPPLHLCLLVLLDSPLQYDLPRYKMAQQGVDTLVRKLQVAGRMMQLFTQQEMARNGFGPRVFRFVENDDNSINVHIIKSSKSLAQLRDVNLAQQNPKGSNTGGLFLILGEDLRRTLPLVRGLSAAHPLYLAVIFLDAHWDPRLKMILTHLLLGGGTDTLKLAIFGSHGLWSWPTSFAEIAPCFHDEHRTDTKEVANDCNECSTLWECLNVTMGLFLHEIGHLYGCPHEENGIMLRDYVRFNRSFMTSEKFSVRTGQKLWGPVLSKDECHWHRFDLLRFLHNPAFALPRDVEDPAFAGPRDGQVQLLRPMCYPLPASRSAMVEAKTGVFLVTCHVGEWAKFHLEYLPRSVGGVGLQRKVVLSYDEIQAYLLPQFRGKRLDVEILCCGGQQTRIDDFSRFVSSQQSSLEVDLGAGRVVRCCKGALQGRPEGRAVGPVPLRFPNETQLTKVRIHSGLALDGIEFFGYPLAPASGDAAPPVPPRDYSLSSVVKKLTISGGAREQRREQLICRIGNVTNHYHDFDVRPGEFVSQLNVRCGAWVDAAQVVLSSGRASPMYGGTGGGVSELRAPDGMSIVLLYGNLGQWLNGIGIYYA